MNLTKEDLAAISKLVDEKLAPFHETQKELLKTQIIIVEDIRHLKARVDMLSYGGAVRFT